MTTPTQTLCPSAQHDHPEAQVFAVVGGTLEQPETAYLDQTLPVTPELIEMTAPVSPAEVFRIAAPCLMSTACWHFDEPRQACRLAIRTVRMAPVIVSKPPRCAIRGQCQWWHQEGVSACLRCPQVLTNDVNPDALIKAAGDPRNLSDAA
jgi:hypothetical protein